MLEMQNLSKVYRTELLETHALRDFSLKVEPGEFVAVTGPSGSGKTTFLNVTGLLETFETGTYRLDGDDVSRLDDDARSRVRNRKIGFIFQSFNLIPDLDVRDNVDVPLRYRRMAGAERKSRIDRALDLVGLASRSRHYPAQLSGGQQQRVAIARALAGDPAVLLADEPTGNLDSLMARQVLDLLEQINGLGTTIIMVTHDPELARRAHRNVQVIDGQITDFKPYEAPHARAGQDAQAGLGLLYSKGDGVPQDYVQARQWYEKAAAQGKAIAQVSLGILDAYGYGAPKDYQQAVRWFRLAADQGDALAQMKLGGMSERGEGLPQDVVQAYKWYTLAETNGGEESDVPRRLLAKRMTPAQIAEAQQRMRQWKLKHK
jgi:putative ABC transport system ATP-binding protein